MKVLTLNIWNDAGPWSNRLTAIREGLAQFQPDIVALQEVLNLEELAQHVAISEFLGYEAVFGRASTTRGDGQFGNAILSKYPVLSSEVLSLPTEEGDETRGAIICRVQTPKGELTVVSTHLSYRMDQGEIRSHQVKALLTKVAALHGPTIVMGDFNASPDQPEMLQIVDWIDCFELKGSGEGITFSPMTNQHAQAWNEPERRIDYIFLAGDGLAPENCRVCLDEPIVGVYPSDHYGVYAEIADLRN